MTDFLIVGNGLASNVLAHTFKNYNITFNQIGNSTLSNCSYAAAGIWNPIVFKRMTKSWLADELINFLVPFYTNIQTQFKQQIITHRPILKSFFEEQEKTLWLKKAEGELEYFLDKTIYTLPPNTFKNSKITSEYSFVKKCGNLDVAAFILGSNKLFVDFFKDETFNYENLKIENDFILYKNKTYKNIIFAEGHLVKNNPFLNWIPLKPAKGEIITIKSSEIEIENTIINKNGFIFNTTANTFNVGATYEWADLTDNPTQKAKAELEQKLTHLITGNYQIINHQAGIRPSSIDRRPIIGTHPKHKNLHIFNGLGTKGVMLAPYFANNFVLFYQQKKELIKEIDVKRFYKLFDYGI